MDVPCQRHRGSARPLRCQNKWPPSCLPRRRGRLSRRSHSRSSSGCCSGSRSSQRNSSLPGRRWRCQSYCPGGTHSVDPSAHNNAWSDHNTNQHKLTNDRPSVLCSREFRRLSVPQQLVGLPQRLPACPFPPVLLVGQARRGRPSRERQHGVWIYRGWSNAGCTCSSTSRWGRPRRCS